MDGYKPVTIHLLLSSPTKNFTGLILTIQLKTVKNIKIFLYQNFGLYGMCLSVSVHEYV